MYPVGPSCGFNFSEAQVARSVAASLSILEDVTPGQLMKILDTALVQSKACKPASCLGPYVLVL